MSNGKGFTATTLSWKMFGKRHKDLTIQEKKQYNKEKKRTSRLNPEVLEKDKEYQKEWRNKNRDHVNEYKRLWRANKKCKSKIN